MCFSKRTRKKKSEVKIDYYYIVIGNHSQIDEEINFEFFFWRTLALFCGLRFESVSEFKRWTNYCCLYLKLELWNFLWFQNGISKIYFFHSYMWLWLAIQTTVFCYHNILFSQKNSPYRRIWIRIINLNLFCNDFFFFKFLYQNIYWNSNCLCDLCQPN